MRSKSKSIRTYDRTRMDYTIVSNNSFRIYSNTSKKDTIVTDSYIITDKRVWIYFDVFTNRNIFTNIAKASQV